MRIPLVVFLCALCFPLVTHSISAQDSATAEEPAKRTAPAKLVPAATAFLDSLSEAQREQATLAMDSEKRVQWHFIPMKTRKGLPVMEMTDADQKQAAMELLRAAVSKLGYEKATNIMQLESLLRQLEGADDPKVIENRNPEKYYFTIFGTPAMQSRWGLSVEGHHLSLNFVLNGNKVLDSTPQFFAANPAVLKEDYGDQFPKGLRVLRAEEQLAFKLVRSFGEEQFEMAELPGETPGEIRGAGEAQPPTTPLPGIPVSELNDEQVTMLKALMKAYTNKMKVAVSKQRWKLIEDAGFENIKFSWSGGTRPGVGHYYAVQGPTFVIEFVNMQADAAGNPANHIHCVWRDMAGDFDLPIAAK